MPAHVTAGDTAGACDQPIAPALIRTDPAKNHGDAWLGAEKSGKGSSTNPWMGVVGGGLRKEGCQGT